MTLDEHDAFREQRKTSLYWLHKATEELELLDKFEDVLPSFVQRRYRISNLSESSLTLHPQNATDEAADALHADVGKLYAYLLGKRADKTEYLDEKPKRALSRWNGTVSYRFHLEGLPGFQFLSVEVNGLPAGSACQITKKVTGYRMHEESEYVMVCEDEPAGVVG